MKISIITATYNSISFLKDCIKSVDFQNYKNVEHIIIDGGSTDGTISLLNSKRELFKVIVSEPDKGMYDAMNKGINLATGDVIGFLNSDDFYATNDVLSSVAKIFSKNKLYEACYSDLVYTKQTDTNKNIRYWKSCKFQAGLFSKGWCPPHPTFFIRSLIFKKFGIFNLKYHIASDVELMMRYLEVHRINTCYVPELWVKMRLGGTTNKNIKNILLQNKEVLSALKSHNLSYNWIIFFINEIISRLIQRFQKPPK